MIRAEMTRWPEGRTPAFLMIDDVGDLVVGDTQEGDWGGLGIGPNSTWEFFTETYRRAVPRLRAVFFVSPGQFLNARLVPGIKIQRQGKIVELLEVIARARWAEIGFHGMDHTRLDGRPECSGLEDPKMWLARGKSALEELTGAKVLGGKCPGYEGYELVEKYLTEAGFRWWADAWTPVRGGRGCFHGGRGVITNQRGVRLFPSNIGAYTGLYRRGRSVIERLFMKRRMARLFARARFLVEKGIPVTIQTHYAALRPDGARQVYNLYDDRPLLLPLLTGLDDLVWWALPREICDYLDTVESMSFLVDGFKLIINSERPRWDVSFRIHPCPSYLMAPEGYRVYPKKGLFTFLPKPGAYEAVF
ncbi:MAG: hypothetical protein ABIM74_00725 [candidate division WOR-3 bacterium]